PELVALGRQDLDEIVDGAGDEGVPVLCVGVGIGTDPVDRGHDAGAVVDVFEHPGAGLGNLTGDLAPLVRAHSLESHAVTPSAMFSCGDGGQAEASRCSAALVRAGSANSLACWVICWTICPTVPSDS